MNPNYAQGAFGWNYNASAAIRCGRVCYTHASTSNTCTEAGAATFATRKPVGISHMTPKFAPGGYESNSILTSSELTHAEAGDPVGLFTEGQIAFAIVGATAVTDLNLPVVATTDGKVIPSVPDVTAAPTTYEWAVGFPLETGTAGQVIRVLVRIFATPI